MKKITFLSIIAMISMVMCFVSCVKTQPEEMPVPEISIVGTVPESGNVGDKIRIPAVTVKDSKYGNLTNVALVSVCQMRDDGVTVHRDILFEKYAEYEQTFTITSSVFLNYKIIYTCENPIGKKAEKFFNFKVYADKEAGILTLNTDDIPNFDIKTGISGLAYEKIVLPNATAIDEPNSINISNRVEAKIYEKLDGKYQTNPFLEYSDFTEKKEINLPAGNYQIIYSVKDASGNVFPTKYTFPITVSMPAPQNLINNSDYFSLDNLEGRSWYNEHGELAFGNTSADANLTQTVGFSSNATKIHEQIVGITFIADIPGVNGQSFYTISARGSNNRNMLPISTTGCWPTYMFLRLTTTKIEARLLKTNDVNMTTIKSYDKTLIDGKQHSIYVQWLNVGNSASDIDSAIMLYGWIDKLPSLGYNNADLIYKTISGNSTGTGVLEKNIYEELWNETGAGWYSMDSFGNDRPYGDDHMRISGFVVYDKNETSFNADIKPPVLSADFDSEKIYPSDESIQIPDCTVDGTETLKAYIINPNNDKNEVTAGGQYTPDVLGKYKLLFEATDTAGNYGYLIFNFTVAFKDTVCPVLTISDTNEINVNYGQTVTLPSAAANDNIDGDISNKITVTINGTEYLNGLIAGGTYTPKTAGRQMVTYKVEDTFGNASEKIIYINVQSNTAGNMLSSPLTISDGSNGLKDSEYIYEQKVSTIINISNVNTIIMFNIRGGVVSNDWPKGIVVRITDTGNIDISAQGHDTVIYGSTKYKYQNYWLSTDILFEYQTKTVIIDGIKYLRTQIWVQGEALDFFSANSANGGYKNLEPEINAIYRKVSDFQKAQPENLYSSPFWIAAFNSSLTVKEVRIDGTSCAKPADPIIPTGYALPAFETEHSFITSETIVTASDGGTTKLGKNSNEDYISISFKGQNVAKGCLAINIIGEVNNYGWGGGLVLRLSQDGFGLYANGSNAALLAYLDGFAPYDNNLGLNDNEYTIVYKLTYIVNSFNLVEDIQVDIWAGSRGGAFTKLTPRIHSENSGLSSYDSATNKYIVIYSAFNSESQIVPKDIVAVNLSALNSACQWTILEVKQCESM